jgi:hypothetical protein
VRSVVKEWKRRGITIFGLEDASRSGYKNGTYEFKSPERDYHQ